MSKNGIRVEEFNIYMLGAEAVSYHLKDIHTLALQVTREKIGGLSLELEVELTYGVEGEPRLSFWAARGTKNEPENDRNIIVQPGDWLVVLWDEIHKFKDEDFRSTFSFDEMPTPAEKGVHIPIGEMIRETHEQIKNMDFAGALKSLRPQVDSGYRAGSLFKSEGQEPEFYEEKQLDELRKKLDAEYPKDGETTQIVPSVGAITPEETERVIGAPVEDVWGEQKP
jgi:hypothetical protein